MWAGFKLQRIYCKMGTPVQKIRLTVVFMQEAGLRGRLYESIRAIFEYDGNLVHDYDTPPVHLVRAAALRPRWRRRDDTVRRHAGARAAALRGLDLPGHRPPLGRRLGDERSQHARLHSPLEQLALLQEIEDVRKQSSSA